MSNAPVTTRILAKNLTDALTAAFAADPQVTIAVINRALANVMASHEDDVNVMDAALAAEEGLLALRTALENEPSGAPSLARTVD